MVLHDFSTGFLARTTEDGSDVCRRHQKDGKQVGKQGYPYAAAFRKAVKCEEKYLIGEKYCGCTREERRQVQREPRLLLPCGAHSRRDNQDAACQQAEEAYKSREHVP